MAKRPRYVKRPCKSLDSPALWDWLWVEHPELMEQFNIAFIHEVREYICDAPSQYPALREHVEKFVKCGRTQLPTRSAMTTKTVKLPKDHKNTFCGLTFICPICGDRNCVWRRLRRQGKTWLDEYYCTNTGQSLQALDLLAALKEEHGEPLPAFIELCPEEQVAPA